MDFPKDSTTIPHVNTLFTQPDWALLRWEQIKRDLARQRTEYELSMEDWSFDNTPPGFDG